jgi:hypothetical protein
MAFHTKRGNPQRKNNPHLQQPILSIKEKKEESREIWHIRQHIRIAKAVKQNTPAKRACFQARGNDRQAARQATILFSLMH